MRIELSNVIFICVLGCVLGIVLALAATQPYPY
jgi:hypothetical protein